MKCVDERLFRWLPHRPPMMLLDEVLDVCASSATCLVHINEDSSFYLPSISSVPSCVGLEYMGQTAAVSDGWQTERGLIDPCLGFFLGCRRYVAYTSRFDVGTSLRVTASGATFVGDYLATFDCCIARMADDKKLAEGSLSVLRKPLVDGRAL